MKRQASTKSVTGPVITPVSAGLVQRKCACGIHTFGGGECAGCARKNRALQRQPAHGSQGGHATAVPASVYEVLRSPGRPLDAQARAFMEPRFGHDFSRVRVHSDARAAESARSVGALAYTVGRNIVIPSWHLQNSSAGMSLLAHELTHVVQQDGHPAEPPSNLEVSRPDESAEREAGEVAASVLSRGTNHGTRKSSGVRLARQTAETPAPAVPTPQQLMDAGDAVRMRILRRAIFQAGEVERACDRGASPLLMVEAFPREVRPFVSWLGAMPTDSSFCAVVRWAKALMIENMNVPVPPFIFPGPDDAVCRIGGGFPYAVYEDTQIRICPKLVDPQSANTALIALVLIHELFHDPRFQMEHPTPEVMNSAHCGFIGSFEAITNPYCMTNLIGHLGGGDMAVM